MNAEFVKEGESKIIIPTVFREDYLLSLRKLSRSKVPNVYIEMLSKAHKFSGSIYSNSFDEMYNNLKERNAFYELDEGKYLKLSSL